MSKIHVATFIAHKVGAIGLATEKIAIEFACPVDATTEEKRDAAWAELRADADRHYATHEHFRLHTIGIARTNREGLTFGEWLAAAGRLEATKPLAAAWQAGEDPTEYR